MKSLVWFITGESRGFGLEIARAIPMGTPHEQINGSAAAIARGKPELLDKPSIPAA